MAEWLKNSYFKRSGNKDITRFLKEFVPRYKAMKGNGCIGFITCNHDTPRSSKNLDPEELKLAYATLITLPERFRQKLLLSMTLLNLCFL